MPIAHGLIEPTRAFYAAWGAHSSVDNADVELPVGNSLVVFVPAESGRPFHHFALLVPAIDSTPLTRAGRASRSAL